MKNNSTTEWEKEFDELQVVDDMVLGTGIPFIKIIGEHNVKQIKFFIRSLIDKQKKEIIKEIDNELDHLRRLTNKGNKQAQLARKRIKKLKMTL